MTETEPKSLAALNRLIAASEPLVTGSKRAVLGEGPMHPAMAFVGEQPGDQEDIEGSPIRRSGRSNTEPRIRRCRNKPQKNVSDECCQTFQIRGARQTPDSPEADSRRSETLPLVADSKNSSSCNLHLSSRSERRPRWRSPIRPISVMKQRGPMTFEAGPGYVTVHPSYLLRVPDRAAKNEAFAAFVEDLRSASSLAASLAASQSTKVKRHQRSTLRD